MTDHGELDEIEIEEVLGEMVLRMTERLKFAPDAHAQAGFALGDTQYEITIKVKPA